MPTRRVAAFLRLRACARAPDSQGWKLGCSIAGHHRLPGRGPLGDPQDVLTPRTWTAILLCTTVIGACAGCGSSSAPAVPTGPTDCTFTVTMTSFTTTPSPAQGTRYEFFFSSNILVSAAAVYLVDGNAAPVRCTTLWTGIFPHRC